MDEVRVLSHPQPAPCLGSEACKTVGQLPKQISIPSMSRYEYLALLSELPPCLGMASVFGEGQFYPSGSVDIIPVISIRRYNFDVERSCFGESA
jgi:hypothetical protein